MLYPRSMLLCSSGSEPAAIVAFTVVVVQVLLILLLHSTADVISANVSTDAADITDNVYYGDK